MALKDKLLENKKLNEQIKFAISESQSRLAFDLGESDSKVQPIDFADLFNPLVKLYSELQLDLQNGTSDNPVADRKAVDKILGSVQVVKAGLENLASNTEVWDEMMQNAGLMGGLDLIGTPVSRFLALNIINGDLAGKLEIKMVDDDLNKLAFEIYEKDGRFVERIFINKLNELSESQEMFLSIPNTLEQNENFKFSSPEIFEVEQQGSNEANQALTGGVTETYRKKKKDGELEINTKDIGNNLVQDFYIIDKEAIGDSLQFNTEMDKITSGLLEESQSFDQVTSFNNNMLATVTGFYLNPYKALTDKQQLKFQEDYKKWYLETQIGVEFPLGDPKPKTQQEQSQEEQPLANNASAEMVAEETLMQ